MIHWISAGGSRRHVRGVDFRPTFAPNKNPSWILARPGFIMGAITKREKQKATIWNHRKLGHHRSQRGIPLKCIMLKLISEGLSACQDTAAAPAMASLNNDTRFFSYVSRDRINGWVDIATKSTWWGYASEKHITADIKHSLARQYGTLRLQRLHCEYSSLEPQANGQSPKDTQRLPNRSISDYHSIS
jgi:hypothetical protein